MLLYYGLKPIAMSYWLIAKDLMVVFPRVFTFSHTEQSS
jgi:hypothetical protein